MSDKIQVPCPKCDGKGYVEGFSHVANGVCFRCSGNKTVLMSKAAYERSNRKPALTPYAAEICETIRKADLSSMSFGKLMKLRDAAHYMPACPEILSVWRERGEAIFMEKQEVYQANEVERFRVWAAN